MTAAGAQLTDRQVIITSPTGKESSSTIRVQEWPADVRTTRAWKRLGMWWGGGLFAALIPPHFPWLGLGLIGGPIAAWLASKQGALVIKQEVTCPDCGTTTTLDEQAEAWPIGVRYSPCRGVYWISPPKQG